MRAVVKKGITVGVGLLLLIGGIPVMGVKRAPARERREGGRRDLVLASFPGRDEWWR